jgi:hypothetical protein
MTIGTLQKALSCAYNPVAALVGNPASILQCA